MDREKFVFKMSTEWSDCSEHSPARTGQLPSVAVLPTGEQVEIGACDIQIAAWNSNVPFRGYVKLGNGISAKESSWGNDGSQSVGRSGAQVEILAPKGTKFLFSQFCEGCDESLAEIPESDLVHGRMLEAFCEKCAKRIAEQDEWLAEVQSGQARELDEMRKLCNA